MDVHLRSLLCDDGIHTFLPQLPDLVISRARDDHLYGMVFGHCSSGSWPGKKKKIPSTLLCLFFILYKKEMFFHPFRASAFVLICSLLWNRGL
uniref:Uncharacterized protein n=1 Tax=Nelumbo nucifera TaxID=4432 RepID=A0A822Y335_NELNU|nr:TPA_asm: hypothetical protein HUJ06_028140 [Nelumbo nucifera]